MASHWVGTWTATPAPADGVALSSPDHPHVSPRQHRRRDDPDPAVERRRHGRSCHRHDPCREAGRRRRHPPGHRPDRDVQRLRSR